MADIEVYSSYREIWIVDVTLSSDIKTQLFEVRRLMAHNPSLAVSLNIKRALIAPKIKVKHQNIIPIEIKPVIRDLKSEKPRITSYWEKVETTIRTIIGSRH